MQPNLPGFITLLGLPTILSAIQIFFMLTTFVHDSPKYLHSKGETQKSLKALNLLYSHDGGNYDEFKALSENKDDVILYPL